MFLHIFVYLALWLQVCLLNSVCSHRTLFTITWQQLNSVSSCPCRVCFLMTLSHAEETCTRNFRKFLA